MFSVDLCIYLLFLTGRLFFSIALREGEEERKEGREGIINRREKHQLVGCLLYTPRLGLGAWARD